MFTRSRREKVRRFRLQTGELDGVPGARPCDRVLSSPPVKVQTSTPVKKKKRVVKPKTNPSKMKAG